MEFAEHLAAHDTPSWKRLCQWNLPHWGHVPRGLDAPDPVWTFSRGLSLPRGPGLVDPKHDIRPCFIFPQFSSPPAAPVSRSGCKINSALFPSTVGCDLQATGEGREGGLAIQLPTLGPGTFL